jgi:hypothetical protein
MKTAELSPSVRWFPHRWFALGLVLFFVLLSIPYCIKAFHGGSAFLRWEQQILAMGEGVDIAQRYNYPNPPIMALLLYPLARLPTALTELGMSEKIASTIAALCWFYIKVALTLLAFRWVFQLVEERARPFPMWAKCLTVLLALRPIMSDLQHGNVNLFILFLIVASLTAYYRERDVLSGIVLGLAIACKVTPALFVPYFLWKRSWKALVGCVLGLALFLWPGFVPALLMGSQRNQEHLVSWYHDMVYPFVVEGKVTSEHHNQSLPGLVSRLATHSASFSTYVNGEYTPTHYSNLLDLDPAIARGFVKACMGLFALMVVWICKTPTTPRDGWRLSAEFSIIVLGMLLFSERTWKHHCVTLVLPFAVICYYLATSRPTKGLLAYLIATLVASMALMATTSNTAQDGAAHSDRLVQLFAKQAQVYGAFVVAYFVLLAALIVLLRRPSEVPSAQDSSVSRAA